MPNIKIYINCKGAHCYQCSFIEGSETELKKYRCRLFKTNLEENPQMVLEEDGWNKYKRREYKLLRCSSCHYSEITDPNEYPKWENMID